MDRAAVRQDAILTDYARLLAPKPGAFLWADPVVNPVTDVDEQSGQFHDIAGGFAASSPDNDLVMADGEDRPPVISLSISKVDGWLLNLRALGIQVDKNTERYLRRQLDVQRASVAVLLSHINIYRERALASLLFSGTTFSGYTAAVPTVWSDDSSNPIKDAQTAIDNVIQSSGVAPNTLTVGYQVHKALRAHPLLQELYTRTKGEVLISNDMIAAALGVEHYRVGMAVGNTADPNLTESRSYIWGKYALFAHIQPAPSPMTPQSCVQRWRLRGFGDNVVKRYDLPGGYKEQIDICNNDQFTVPSARLGYLFSSVVT